MTNIYDVPFKRALGELILYAATSEMLDREVEDFLARVNELELVRFEMRNDPVTGDPVIFMEPSDTLQEFLALIRKRRSKAEIGHT